MRKAFALILVGIAACIIGIGSAYITLERNLQFNVVKLGPWEIWPVAGEPTADPYSKAMFARAGSVWLSSTEGIALQAKRDVDHQPLTSNCDYQLTGKIPKARLWTLTTIPEGNRDLITNIPASFITSEDVIWNADETLNIHIAKSVKPGNWLQLTPSSDFTLMLRLYDTPLTSSALDRAIETPLIKRGACR